MGNHAFENELSSLLVKVAGVIADEDQAVRRQLNKWREEPGDTLEKRAKIAEFKIRKDQISRIKSGVSKLLKGSTNRLVVSTIEAADN